jgi:4-hydroxybenzoyl-CoA thioesterase
VKARAMVSNIRTTRIEWGQCDSLGIIFYPRYFEMFDTATTVLIERALGMNKIDYLKAYRFAGHPLVETRARFRFPTRYGDNVAIETRLVECAGASFKVEHRLTKDGAVAVEGFETRVWVVHPVEDPKRMQSQPIPPEVLARFQHSAVA